MILHYYICKSCWEMHHFRSKILSLPILKLHSCLENHVINSNSNQDYNLITFARAGCERKYTTKEIIISHFLLRIFNLNVATFQHHLHMEYIFLGLCYIPELVVHVIVSVINGCC